MILGLPAERDEGEEAIIVRTAKRHIPDLQPRDALVTVQVTGDLVPPFWTKQMTWQQNEKLVRFGHQYLSIHHIRQGEKRYDRYENTLAPAVDAWTEISAEAARNDPRPTAIDRVGFGYVNSFQFPNTPNFDLSKYFRLNVGVHVGTPAPELLGVDTGFHFLDKNSGAYLTLNLSAQAVVASEAPIRVTTKVFAEQRGIDGVRWQNVGEIRELVRKSKDVAKTVFFDFATDETHTLMGAVTDAAVGAPAE